MSEKKVSIVVPVYNGERYIHTVMNGLLAQTYKNIEIILVDDGSRDGSAAICDDYEKKDKRISVIHKSNGGLPSARNAGISIASGDYILFVDVDDEIIDSTVEDNLRLALDNEADVVIFNFWYEHLPGGKKIENQYSGSFSGKQSEFFSSIILGCIPSGMFSAPWNKLIRIDILKENNIDFNQSYSVYEDLIFSPKVLSAAKHIVVNSNCYYIYKIQKKGTLLSSFHRDTFEALCEYLKQAYAYSNIFEDNSRQKEEFDKLFLGSTIMYIKRTSKTSEIDYSEKKKVLKTICTNSDITRILTKFPFKGKKLLVSWMMRHKMYGLIILLYKVKK